MPGRRPVLAAAALALALNLAGVGWGLPSRFHPDEKADVVAAMVRERRPLPDSYVNPSLPLALTAPVIALQQALPGRMSEPWSDPLLAGRIALRPGRGRRGPAPRPGRRARPPGKPPPRRRSCSRSPPASSTSATSRRPRPGCSPPRR